MEVENTKLMPLKANEFQALMKFKEMLSKKYQLLDLRLFGSKAKGIDTKESDIDLLIELDQITPEIEEEIDRIAFDINLEFNCLISSIIYSREELEKGSLSESPLYKNAQREGIKI